jgi:hypothetical protein
VTEIAPAAAGTGVPFPFFTYRGLDNLLANDLNHPGFVGELLM